MAPSLGKKYFFSSTYILKLMSPDQLTNDFSEREILIESFFYLGMVILKYLEKDYDLNSFYYVSND